jgi:predicted Zn finger-like uncharacterized protein
MILTCPECGTQYVVKEGAIPPGGRQVRCAACKHSWHQDPEPGAAAFPEEVVEPAPVEAPPTSDYPEESREQPVDEGAPADEGAGVGFEQSTGEQPAGYAPVEQPAEEYHPPPDVQAAVAEVEAQASAGPESQNIDVDEFSPFAERFEGGERRRRPLLAILIILILIAAAAAAFWFFAPVQWKERVGLVAAQSPLEVMITHSGRQQLASGNELLAVTGRVINSTDETHKIPPIYAQLENRQSGKIIHRWTITPPAPSLPPRASATFNSAEMNVPPGGDNVTITLGAPKA